MLGMGIVIPFMPIYARTLGASGITIGIFFASFPLAQILFMPLIGKMSDRYGRKGFIAGGLLLSSLLSVAYVFTPDIWSLTIVRFFQGLAVALILPISSAYVGDLAEPQKRGELMGIFNLFLTSSIGVGPLLGGWATENFGMDVGFYLMGILNFLAFVIAFLFLAERRSSQSALEQPSYGALLKRIGIQGIALYRTVTAIQTGLWFSFLPLLAVEILGINQSRVGVVIAAYMLMNSLVQVPFGRLADRYRKRVLIVWSGFLTSLAFAALMFIQNFGELILVSAFVGIAGALAQPALSAIAAEEGKQCGMGAVMGLLSMAFSLGMMLGPVLAGLLSEILGLRLIFCFGAVAGILGTGMFAWLMFEREARDVTATEKARN